MPVVGSTQPIYELQLGAFRQGLKEGGGFAEGIPPLLTPTGI
jgi:hypothetical protein